MTPAELNKLSETEQRNALLAIALGYDLQGDYATKWLARFNPEQDGALMWKLVCVLADDAGGIDIDAFNLTKSITTSLNFYESSTYEQSLIAAYIAADPKGLITKWRKEND